MEDIPGGQQDDNMMTKLKKRYFCRINKFMERTTSRHSSACFIGGSLSLKFNDKVITVF